ncbi:splicing factor CWC22 [Seminavis robusta]|uniref:Splicing factor CWC22 n=1 Tax=Seminavis robusta TaxID=568900 RepID=A0A9N8E288_9STRA|nr:splicing factor CWC22 [Seminavis robusta]|eukprot:Sro545_g163840.1 splicing factor CWC22 (776) ;mRNA; r:19342-21669
MAIRDGKDDEEGEVVDEPQDRKQPGGKQPGGEESAVGTKRSATSRLEELSSSGVYIPPAKRRQLEKQAAEERKQQADDEKDDIERKEVDSMVSAQQQRKSWEDEKRVVHGTINRLNEETVKPLIHDLFDKVNLIRLRGVLAKSVLQAAVSSPRYSNVYAALISVINSKLPEVGELVVKRAILSFRRHYRRREKQSCLATAIFLAHLFHQQMVHELLILQILSLLLDGDPTDDSCEIAVQLLTVSGNALLEVSPAGVRAVLERLRSLLHEGSLNKRVEYKMEKLLALRKTGFRDYPPVPEDLDLVESDDQITFEISLDDEDISKEDHLDVFRVDPKFAESEQEWKTIRNEILGIGGSDDDSGDSDTESGDSDDESDSEDDAGETVQAPPAANNVVAVRDLSESDLVHLRRSIYLTIMSSATFEECTHKLAKVDIPEGREEELINMLIECCSQERTFLRYYGLISARFCLLDERWKIAFMEAFTQQYNTIHRLETNKLRNVAKLFAHLLHTDAMPWTVLNVIHLNEDETTSSSRIFVKILVQEIAEAMGISKLKSRFETEDPVHMEWYKGMFPKDNIRSTRYAINFFTSIGLGPLTDALRTHLKNAPKLIMAQAQKDALAKKDDDDDSSVLSSSSSSSSDSSSLSSSSSSGSSSDSDSSSSSSSYSRRRPRRRGRRSKRSRSPSSSSSGSSDSSGSSRSRRRSKKGKDKERRRGRSPSYASDEESSRNRHSKRRRTESSKRKAGESRRSPDSKSDKGKKDRNTRGSRSRSRSRSVSD